MRTYFNLYRISCYLLVLATIGHTFGGILGTAQRGVGSPEADTVFAQMKSVHFLWNGADCTWFGFFLGNGLCVTALLFAASVALWTLGGLDAGKLRLVWPISAATFISLAATTLLGFKYFATGIGVGFGVIAVLTGIATIKSYPG